MKHQELVTYARGLLEEIGLVIQDEILDLCVRHVEWVLRTNAALNLTAIVEPREAVRLHLVDSLAALEHVLAGPAGLLVDIGTGAGIPGLPLAVASQREAVLIDSVAKKVNAVESFLAENRLERQVRIFPGRSEAYALQSPASAGVVVARAVAELPVLLELACPILRHGGALIALKGRLDANEVGAGECVAAKVGLALTHTKAYWLPNGGEQRTMAVFTKVGETDVPLPRRPGMAKKRPLC